MSILAPSVDSLGIAGCVTHLYVRNNDEHLRNRRLKLLLFVTLVAHVSQHILQYKSAMQRCCHGNKKAGSKNKLFYVDALYNPET